MDGGNGREHEVGCWRCVPFSSASVFGRGVDALAGLVLSTVSLSMDY